MHRERTTDLARKRAQSLRRKLTIPEKTLWSALRGSQLGFRFRRQEPIGQFIVDFVCFARSLIVEVDGPHHDWSESDVHRDEFLRSLGYRVLRFENREVAEELNSVVGTIENFLNDPTLRA